MLVYILILLTGCECRWFRLSAEVEEELMDARGKKHTNITKFDYFMFTQIYPTAVCRADDDSVPGSCAIPANAPTWTVHGLWPSYFNGSYPQFCDGTPRHFNASQVAEIHDQLVTNWPNLYPDHAQASLWVHEWEKHGVCAQKMPVTDSELKYFNMSLYLNTYYDVYKALSDAKITPRKTPYSQEQIQSAFNSKLARGSRVQFNCLKDKVTDEFLLADVRLCLSLGLTPINCPRKLENQPVVELLGMAVPLPAFQKCPARLVYLPKTQLEDTPCNKKPFFYKFPLLDLVNPFINIMPELTMMSSKWIYIYLAAMIMVDYFLIKEVFCKPRRE